MRRVAERVRALLEPYRAETGADCGRPEWTREVVAAVDDHHKITPSRAGGASPLVEAFRKADLIDVTFGLVRLGSAVLVRTPLRPLPMTKR